MADGTLPAEGGAATPPHPNERTYGTICVVGGGCYGSYYVRQLLRARERGALTVDRVLVIDRDPACAVASVVGGVVDLEISDWAVFFARYLAAPTGDRDAVVPSPLMPHLFLHWLESRARARWPARRVFVEAPAPIIDVPWQRDGGDGSRYVSFAEWMCPINCIEPRVCPHTRSERAWSMPVALERHRGATERDSGRVDASAVLHCTHRMFGVGMIDVPDILAADSVVAAAAEARAARVLVGTVSHCHGALGVLAVQ